MKVWIDPTSLKEDYIHEMINRLKGNEVTTSLDQASDADIAVMMPHKINPTFLDQLKKLKYIKLLTAGYNQVDLAELKKRGIQLLYAKDVFSIQIAEDVISKILYINRRLGLYHEYMKESKWQFEAVTHEIFGSTVGIIGAGSIGDEVAKRLKAFQTKIIGYRRSKINSPYFDEMVHDHKGFEYIVSTSDILVISIPLTKDTYHLINEKVFNMMKPNVLIVNVARGEIIDQDALINALQKKVIRAAALDVTTPEPLPKDHPLWQQPHLFITPHQASASPYMHKRMIDEAVDSINCIIEGKTLDNLVHI